MDLPNQLKIALQEIATLSSFNNLHKNFQNLSNRYRFQNRTGQKILTRPDEAISYALTRMPATFGAVSCALKQTLQNYDKTRIKTLLDVGSGPGTATWAALQVLDLKQITCLEHVDAMENLARIFAKKTNVSTPIIWKKTDISQCKNFDKADLVIASYALNEISPSKRISTLFNLWNSTQAVLLIVEPGTPEGYTQLMQYRTALINEGAFLIAPCPHHQKCPLKESNWCHFSSRIIRTKEHRILKNATLGYENEKFSYLAISKNPPLYMKNRVLSQPSVHSGHINLSLCSTDATFLNITVSKRNSALYKQVKKLKWGDTF